MTSLNGLNATQVIEFLNIQTGLNLTPDDHFSGIRYQGTRKYANVLLQERVTESQTFLALESFANTFLDGVEPNGLYRVAVFF
jgi:hypothetical protein